MRDGGRLCQGKAEIMGELGRQLSRNGNILVGQSLRMDEDTGHEQIATQKNSWASAGAASNR